MKNHSPVSRQKPKKQNPSSTHSPATHHSPHLNGPITPGVVISLQKTIGNQAVQRLMSVDEFKSESKLFGQSLFKRDRNQVVAIDTALGNYNAVNTERANIANKKNTLDALITAIDNYLAGTGKRKSAVRKLKADALREQTIIDLLVNAEASAPVQRFEYIVKAQDKQIDLINQGKMSSNRTLVNFDAWFMHAIGLLRNDPADIQQVIQNELDRLTNIMNDDATPPIIQKILAEVLGNTDDVHFDAGTPGARFKKPTEGFAEKYVVTHNLNAPDGSAERLGSLTHELTHVSVSETFDNSALFLAFKTGASDQEIVQLSSKRTEQLKTLLALMERSRRFNDSQKSLLRNKITYPYGPEKGDIGRYLNSMKDKIPAPLRLRLQGLLPQGINNSLIEFDTVINQMMIYMHLWEIPQDDAFYAKLTEIAQEAYDYRAAARG
jgi:hypothetical protein